MTQPTAATTRAARASCTALVLLLVAAGSAPVGAQQASTHESHEAFPLFTRALGPLSRPVSSATEEAQKYFDQGVQMLYAFTQIDAQRSFEEAQRLDPRCAMCAWGEAWSRGAYLNGPMSNANAEPATAAAQRALRLARETEVAPVELALIEAMATRYEAQTDAQRRRQLDSAYARAMEKVAEAYPNDLDVLTLYAESLMLLLPRRATWKAEDPAVAKIHSILEKALVLDIGHPGACHLYVHATEANQAGKAEKCAELLGQSIPGASHINHMPSHTFNRIGRWDASVRANLEAWWSDQKAEYGEGVAIYPSHNLHMLLFAAANDGQGAIAIQAAKDYAKIVPGGVFYQVMTLVRFGRFDEVLPLVSAPTDPVQRGIWDWGRGYAHLRTGSPDSARASLRRVREIAETYPERTFRSHPAEVLLGSLAAILDGEILREEGSMAEGIAALEKAVELEDQLGYDEPEPLVFSARHWLGAALLEADRPADAQRVYEAELEDHPRNGWSLFGLEKALRAQGRTAEADAAAERFQEAWARSDHWIRASRF